MSKGHEMKPNRLGSRCAWLALALLAVAGVNVHAADQGAEAYERGACHACHTIGGGRLVGPDLAGVSARRPRDWLVSFTRSSQSLIQSGDADAVALYEEYGQILMPDPPVSDQDILTILDYIEAQSAGAASGEAAAVVAAPAAAPSEEQIALGQDLFQGIVRFERGGATCNACHDIAHDAVIGGGILARELTDVFPRMGGAGVKAILGQPPFPVMEAAYADQSLTDSEMDALVAFLQRTANEYGDRLPRDYGLGLFTSGVAGAIVVFGSCSLIWRRRKSESVNQAIYDRQIKSKRSR